MISRASPFYIPRGHVHGRWVPDRWAQRCCIKYQTMQSIMVLQSTGIASWDFPALFVGIFRPARLAPSCRRDARA